MTSADHDRGRGLLLVGLALAVAVLVAHARVIAGGETWSDIRYHAEIAPPRLAAASMILHGDLPAWWDGSGFGVPLLGEPSHGAMFPLTWLATSPRALDLLLIVQLWWAAFGVAVWGRRMGASEAGALVAGLLVATTGVLASTALRGALPAIAQLPWLAVAATSHRRDRPVVVGIALAAIALTGELGILVDAVVLAFVLGGRAVWPGVVGGLAIGCVQWLTALALVGERAGSSVHGVPLARLVELIVPGSFGSREPERAIVQLAGTSPWAPSVFLGAPLLALAAIVPPARRLLGYVVGLSLAVLLVGRVGWPAWFGAPEAHLAALAIVLAANAARGFDELVTGDRRAILAIVVAAACTAIAGGALVALRASRHEIASAVDRALVDAGLGLVCLAVAIALALRAKGQRGLVGTWLMGVLVVAPNVGAVPSVAPSQDRHVVDTMPPWVELALATPEPRRLFHPVFMESESEHLDDAISTLYGTSPSRWEIDAARSEDPARPVAHDQVWLGAANDGGALLDRFGVGIEILPTGKLESAKLPPVAVRGAWSIILRHTGDPAHLAGSPLANVTDRPVAPPASVLRGWINARDPDVAVAKLFPSVATKPLARGTAVVDDKGDDHADRGPPLPCTIDRWLPGDIAVRCTTDAYGYAVVTSSPTPGWTATVDDAGSEAVWHTVDVLRRGVAVDVGTHAIAWRYRPPWFRAGMVVMLIGLAGLAVLWVRSRPPKPAPSER